MMSDECKIIKKEAKTRKKGVDKLRASKQFMLEKGRTLCRMSVLEGSVEAIIKLSKKGNKDIHSDRGWRKH